MSRYQLPDKSLALSRKYLDDYLLEKQRYLRVQGLSETELALTRDELKSQIERRIHNQDETLNHYLDYKELTGEQALFLFLGFNPHSLDAKCFDGFSLSDNSCLSYFLTKKTKVGRKFMEEFKEEPRLLTKNLIKWSVNNGFVTDLRVLSKKTTNALYSTLLKNKLIEDNDIEKLWIWSKTDVLLAYLITELSGKGVIPHHHRWQIMGSYISQKGRKRLSKIELVENPNDYEIVDKVVEGLTENIF